MGQNNSTRMYSTGTPETGVENGKQSSNDRPKLKNIDGQPIFCVATKSNRKDITKVNSWNAQMQIRLNAKQVSAILEEMKLLEANKNGQQESENDDKKRKKLQNYFRRNGIILSKKENSPKNVVKCLNLEARLNELYESMNNVVTGMTHNYVSGHVNERGLLSFWEKEKLMVAKEGKRNDLSVILFEIDNMYSLYCKSNGNLQFVDKTIKQVCNKLKEYCDWYEKEFSTKWRLFHLDSNVNQFIVITRTNRYDIIEDFATCSMSEISKMIKTFFQSVTLFCSYIICDKDMTDDEMSFRICYDRANSILKFCEKYAKLKDDTSQRIIRWQNKDERLFFSKKCFNLLKSIEQLEKTMSVQRINNYYKNVNKDKQLITHYYETVDKMCHEIERYIMRGADLTYIEPTVPYQFNLLQYAISIGNEFVVNQLIRYNFDCDRQCQRNSENSLIMALKERNFGQHLCYKIAQRITMPNVPDTRHSVASMYAVYRGFWKVLRLLVDKKGAIDYRFYVIDALRKDGLGLFKQTWKEWPKEMKFDCIFEDFGEMIPKEQRTILHMAMMHKSYKILQYCLERNYNFVNDCYDGNGLNLIMYSIRLSDSRALRLLLNFNNADIHKRFACCHNLSAMEYASHLHEKDIVKLLMQYEKSQSKVLPTISRHIRDNSKNSHSHSRTHSVSSDGYHEHYLGHIKMDHRQPTIVRSRNVSLSNMSELTLTSQSQISQLSAFSNVDSSLIGANTNSPRSLSSEIGTNTNRIMKTNSMKSNSNSENLKEKEKENGKVDARILMPNWEKEEMKRNDEKDVNSDKDEFYTPSSMTPVTMSDTNSHTIGTATGTAVTMTSQSTTGHVTGHVTGAVAGHGARRSLKRHNGIQRFSFPSGSSTVGMGTNQLLTSIDSASDSDSDGDWEHDGSSTGKTPSVDNETNDENIDPNINASSKLFSLRTVDSTHEMR